MGSITTENYTYSNGNLSEIKLNNTTSIWKLTAENALGMPSAATTGSLDRSYTYDDYGLPINRVIMRGSVLVQNVGYAFNPQTGNMTWRRDNQRNIQENFGYDGLNRLTSIPGKTISYDVKGNITSYQGVGTYSYNTAKPYAVESITATDYSIPYRNQSIKYNSMHRPVSITENGYEATFTYNGDKDRVKMLIKKNNVIELTRYYIGGQYESDSGVAGTKERLYLGGDAYSAAAVYVKEGSAAWTVNYIFRDYLGSITHVTDASGNIRQELSYDPWGRLRDPSDQILYTVGSEPVPILGRGYTGHEHLTMFGLVNMNARLYEPAFGRFLSPDPYVQNPWMSQNFNRYSYALNNPLRYTDESGELFIIDSWISGLISGGWKEANKRAKNDIKIWGGLFRGNPLQIISWWTWELPQTLVGNIWSSARNLAGFVDQVKYFKGATYVINDNSSKYRGITLGIYINMDIKREYTKEKYEPSWNGGKFTPAVDDMMMHEYGHYLQSQMIGLFYLPAAGLPSLLNRIGWIGTSDKEYFYTEKWANNLSFDFFDSPVDKWDLEKYPVDNLDKKIPWYVFSSNNHGINSMGIGVTSANYQPAINKIGGFKY